MKLTNTQLKLVIPIILKAAKDEPSVELDEFLDRLIEMAQFRGMTMTRITPNADPNDMHGLALAAKQERPERAITTQVDVVHPLFRDPKQKSKRKTA